jgi:flagellar basal-body rod modification protein FlgD
MQVPSVNNQTNTQSTSSTAATPPSVDYNTFLQLLIAEMKNQDPTSPTDATEQISQLAQFSSVEQAVQTNTKLDTLLSSTALTQAEGLIGKTASLTTQDGTAVTGVIKSVSIITGGAVATLSDGSTIALGPGVTIS